MKRRITILGLALTATLISSPAHADWGIDANLDNTVSRMLEDKLLQTRADGYFLRF